MSYQMCCRISSLLNNNHDQNGYLNFQVNTTETYSLQTTGLAREFFAQYAPISYTVPVVHPNPSYSFKFTAMPISGAANSQSGLLTQYPNSCGASPATCLCTVATTCPSGTATAYVPSQLMINDGVTNYYGTGVSYSNGQLLWTPTTTGLYAFQVKIGAGLYYPSGCNWYQTSSCTFQQVSWSVLDFILDVLVPCLATSTTCNHNPYFSTCTGCTGPSPPACSCATTPSPVTFYTGVLKTFPVVAYDQDTWQTLSIQNSILPQGFLVLF